MDSQAVAVREEDYLTQVGDGLLRHVTILGRTTPTLGDSPRARATGLALAIARHWLQAVEAAAGVPGAEQRTVGPPQLPFIANRSIWDPSMPPGGYLGEYPTLPRSTIVRSYDLLWSIIHDRGHALGPVLRAVTWMAFNRGFPQAIRYLFDLQRSGFLFQPATLGQSLDLLIRLRNTVETDHDLAAAVFGEVPRTNLEWLERPYRPELGVDESERTDADPLCAVDLVLQEGLETIARCRGATTYDEWFVGQLNQAVILSVVMGVFETFLKAPDLVTRATLHRVEEIMADAHAFGAARVMGPLLQPSFSLARRISQKFAAVEPDHWRRRVLDDRAVVPDALRGMLQTPTWLKESADFMSLAEIADLPVRWRGISAEAAYPCHLNLRDEPPSPWTSLAPFTDDELRERLVKTVDIARERAMVEAVWTRGIREIQAETSAARKLAAIGDYQGAVGVYERLFERYPWCDALRNRAALARLSAGDCDGALEEIYRAAMGRPVEAAHWGCMAYVAHAAGLPTTARVAQSVHRALQTAPTPPDARPDR